MMDVNSSRRTHGQALVLMVMALIAMLAMTGLIIDGGNAFAQQRASQNASDAASEAGAVVLAQNIMAINGGGAPLTDATVLAAMNASAVANQIQPFNLGVPGNSAGWYTDFRGTLLLPSGSATTDPLAAARVGGGVIPPCTGGAATCVDIGRASGVRAAGNREFQPLVSRVIGFDKFQATAVATAVSGYTMEPCVASQGCALLPLTFATKQNTCDGSGDAVYGSTTWVPVTPPYTSANEVLLSLCKGGEGAFGYLDYGCGTLANQILNPCNSIDFPTWLTGQPGAVSSVEGELDTYSGALIGTYEPGLDEEVLIPFFDGTCNEDRPDSELPVFGTPPFPGECAGNPSGGGALRHYHVPYFIGFIMDDAEVQGSNASCDVPPGGPLPGGNGSGGCLKGWIARIVAGPGSVSGSGSGGSASPLSTQLVR